MIHVQRMPAALSPAQLDLLASAEQQAASYFEQKTISSRQSTYKWDPAPLLQLRKEVSAAFHHKCAFCESPAGIVQFGDVNVFRPRQDTADLNREISPRHYWWLAYAWSNLYWTCQYCSSLKRNLFPVAGERAREGTTGAGLQAEKRLLLDPCEDDPESALVFLSSGHIRPRGEQGKVSVEVFGLNRSDLVDTRKELYANLSQHLMHIEKEPGFPTDRHLAFVRERTGDSAPYAAVARTVFRDLLKINREDPQRTLSPHDATRPAVPAVPAPKAPAPRPIRRKTAALSEALRVTQLGRIEISNFRAIHELDLRFPTVSLSQIVSAAPPARGAPWLMLLGTNGVGKSTVLKAVALALADAPTRARLVKSYSNLFNQRSRQQKGFIRIHLTNGQTRTLHFGRRSRTFHIEEKHKLPPIPVLAYGSTRLLSHSSGRRRTIDLANLFDPHAPLGDAEVFLRSRKSLPGRSFNLLARELKKLLSLDGKGDRFIRTDRGIFAVVSGTRVPLHDLSDGFQSIVSVASHIMANLAKQGAAIEHVSGLVLLDEIEVHLHPSWKIRIVKALREVFPRVRFIVTTHDPLCLRGLRDGEVHHLERRPGGRVAINAVDIPAGLRADQLLTGQWFGLNTTLDEDTLGLMEQHRQLLANPTSDPAERGALERELKGRLGTFTDTSVDRLALSVASKVIGDMSQPLSANERAAAGSKIEALLRQELPS